MWNGQTLVKGVGFDAWRSVGHPLQAINVFQLREVDEILFLDITATTEGRRPNFALIEQLSEKCFVPLTVGGGVTSVDDVRDLLRAGADKVSIKTASDIIKPATQTFGSQAIVCCCDMPEATEWHTAKAGLVGDPGSSTIREEAGELLLQSVPRDGMMCGYHTELIAGASEGLSMPIIASGGAGTYEHFARAIDAGASAVAAGAMWLFTEQTPLEAKKYLKARGYDVRL